MENNMNILLCLDKTYLDKAKTMLESLKRFTDKTMTVYIMSHGLKGQSVDNVLNYLQKKLHITVNMIDVDSNIVQGMTEGAMDFYSIEMYYRILAQFYIPKDVQRVLYLDADIIIKACIDDFYEQSFDEFSLVAIEDVNSPKSHMREHFNKLGLSKSGRYFNSGVLLMNLVKLRKGRGLQEILEVISRMQPVLQFPDQDVLNVLYENDVKYVETAFNCQLNSPEIMESTNYEDMAVLHFAGIYKPWNFRFQLKPARYYWEVRLAQGYRLEYVKAQILYRIYKLLLPIKKMFK